jgi:carbamoyltransferase
LGAERDPYPVLSGIPMVLNTSFNIAGEPIVCTPDDAIRTFFTNGLNALILGRYRVIK